MFQNMYRKHFKLVQFYAQGMFKKYPNRFLERSTGRYMTIHSYAKTTNWTVDITGTFCDAT